jgi:hypothetical protein
MLTAMAYSDETMKRMEASIANAGTALLGVGAAADEVAEVMSRLPQEKHTDEHCAVACKATGYCPDLECECLCHDDAEIDA